MWKHIITLVLNFLLVAGDFDEKDDLPEGVQAKQSIPEQTYAVKPGQTLVVTTLSQDPTFIVAIKLYPGITRYIKPNQTVDLRIISRSNRRSGYVYYVYIDNNLPRKRGGTIRIQETVSFPKRKTKTRDVILPIYQLAKKRVLNKIFKTYNWEYIDSPILDPDQTFKIRVISDGFYTAVREGVTHIFAETYDVHIVTTENGITTAEQQDTTELNNYETECHPEYELQTDGTCQKYTCPCDHGISVGDGQCLKDDRINTSCQIDTCHDGYYFVPPPRTRIRKSKIGRCDPIPQCGAFQHLVPRDIKKGIYEQKCAKNVCTCEFVISKHNKGDVFAQTSLQSILFQSMVPEFTLQVGRGIKNCPKHNMNHCGSCGSGFDTASGTSNTLGLKTFTKKPSVCAGNLCYCRNGETVTDSDCQDYMDQ